MASALVLIRGERIFEDKKDYSSCNNFISKVIHAKYSDGCGHSGYTDSDGIFEYKEGCGVSFWADKVFLGKATPVEVPENLHLKTKKYVIPLGLQIVTMLIVLKLLK